MNCLMPHVALFFMGLVKRGLRYALITNRPRQSLPHSFVFSTKGSIRRSMRRHDSQPAFGDRWNIFSAKWNAANAVAVVSVMMLRQFSFAKKRLAIIVVCHSARFAKKCRDGNLIRAKRKLPENSCEKLQTAWSFSAKWALNICPLRGQLQAFLEASRSESDSPVKSVADCAVYSTYSMNRPLDCILATIVVCLQLYANCATSATHSS